MGGQYFIDKIGGEDGHYFIRGVSILYRVVIILYKIMTGGYYFMEVTLKMLHRYKLTQIKILNFMYLSSDIKLRQNP